MGLKDSLRKDLKGEVEQSLKEKEYGGVRGARYIEINKELRFKVRKGKNVIDIIPFVYGTDLFLMKGKKKGSIAFFLDLYVHRFFNDTKDSVPCLSKNFGKPCPICEEATRLSDIDYEEHKLRIKQLYAKRRFIANVINLREPDDDDTEAGEIQIMDESHPLFYKELIDEANNEGFMDFVMPDTGNSVQFRASESKIGRNTYFEFKSFKFVEREEQYPDSIINEAHALDKLINVYTYEKLEAMLTGEDVEEDEDEEEEVDEEKQKPAKSSRRKKPEPEPEAADDDEDEEDEEEEVEKPAKGGKKAKRAPEPEEDDEEEDEEETEDEEMTCPYGHEFGIDNAETPDCAKKCKKNNKEVYKACTHASLTL